MDNCTKIVILTALLAALVMYVDSATKAKGPVCPPDHCKNHGYCKVVNETKQVDGKTVTLKTLVPFCVCRYPSKGVHCEDSNGLKIEWLVSLAFSLPISVLLLVGVIFMYKIHADKARKQKDAQELEPDYGVGDGTPTITTITSHGSPLDTPRHSQYGDVDVTQL